MIPMPSGILPVILTARGVAKMDRMRRPSSTTWGQYIISRASYVTNVSVVLQWHQTPSANMDATPAQIKAFSSWEGLLSWPDLGSAQKVKVMSFTRPHSLGRLESSIKKALTTIPLNQPHQQTNTFHLSCDQDYLTKMLLITTKVVSFGSQTKQNKLHI